MSLFRNGKMQNKIGQVTGILLFLLYAYKIVVFDDNNWIDYLGFVLYTTVMMLMIFNKDPSHN